LSIDESSKKKFNLSLNYLAESFKGIHMIRILATLLIMYVLPVKAEIIMEKATLNGTLLTGIAQDNGIPYPGPDSCASWITDCEWGVRVRYLTTGWRHEERWVTGFVSHRYMEMGRRAWISRYGTSYPFSTTLPSNATDVSVCWGGRIGGAGGYVSCARVWPSPPPPVCSGSAGIIDFGNLQEDKYNGSNQSTSINITCSGASTIRFTSGSSVTLNNGTRATLTFNGYPQGSNFSLYTGNNTVRVNATLSGVPTLGNFTGSSTVILDVL